MEYKLKFINRPILSLKRVETKRCSLTINSIFAIGWWKQLELEIASGSNYKENMV